MILSGSVGETGKKLDTLFKQAAIHNWILFFAEAEILFGKKSQTGKANDRFVHPEVSYLFQRIEDHPGVVILAGDQKIDFEEWPELVEIRGGKLSAIPDEKLREALQRLEKANIRFE